MKKRSHLGILILLSTFLSVLDCSSVGSDTDVYISQKDKANFAVAPNPEFPQAAERRGEHGQGVYRLTINPKDGSVEEVKVLNHAGRNLDASAVWTLFKWKAKPTTAHQQDVLVDFHMTRFLRQTR
jgi:TonB family protein